MSDLHRSRITVLLTMLLLGGLFPILGGYLLSVSVPDWRWANHETHHLAEGVGAFAALLIGSLLLALKHMRKDLSAYVWLAYSFFGMGVLDGFHSILDAGQGFVWLHSTATFVGGALIVFVWLPDKFAPRNAIGGLFYATFLGSIGLSILALVDPDSIPTMVADGRFTANARALNILGGVGFVIAAVYFYRNHEKFGHTESMIFSTQAFLFGVAGILFEFSELWDGAWWLWHALRLIAYMIVVAYFFSVFMRTQRDIYYYTSQLESANKELETFAYSVSHDLRAPLRAIDGFSQALMDDYGDRLDGDAKLYLERLRAGSQTMGGLIDGILKLSRSTRGEMRYEWVNLSDIVGSIATELKEQEPDRSVSFLIGKGIFARGDARLMRAALENIIGNAWKFTQDKTPAVIEFDGERKGDTMTCFVRDNGAGFDMAYADKLFAPFQRLHRQDEFEGTGIGLSTVERIVHRHGGRIWADGSTDKGATFFIELQAGSI